MTRLSVSQLSHTSGLVLATMLACLPMQQAQAADRDLHPDGQPGSFLPADEANWRDLFGAMTVRTNRIAGIERWHDMLGRAAAGCSGDCPQGWGGWVDKMARLSGISRYAQLKIVNWSANAALVYRSDLSAFGVRDYWASPAESLRNGGDCEDFVAMKYLALRAAGFPEQDLRIVVLQDQKRGQPHAVLVAQLDGIRYVLDNQMDDLVADTSVHRYRPVYSFNGQGKWVHLVVQQRQELAMAD